MSIEFNLADYVEDESQREAAEQADSRFWITDTATARPIYEKLAESLEEDGNTEGLARALDRIASCYTFEYRMTKAAYHLGDSDTEAPDTLRQSALDAFQRAVVLYEMGGSPRGVADVRGAIAGLAENEADEVLIRRMAWEELEALEGFESDQDLQETAAELHLAMASFHSYKEDFEAALVEIMRAEELTENFERRIRLRVLTEKVTTLDSLLRITTDPAKRDLLVRQRNDMAGNTYAQLDSSVYGMWEGIAYAQYRKFILGKEDSQPTPAEVSDLTITVLETLLEGRTAEAVEARRELGHLSGRCGSSQAALEADALVALEMLLEHQDETVRYRLAYVAKVYGENFEVRPTESLIRVLEAIEDRADTGSEIYEQASALRDSMRL